MASAFADSIPTQTFSAISVKPVVASVLSERPWTQCPNDVCEFSEVRKVLSSRDIALYRYLCRQSLGCYQPNVRLSTRAMAKSLSWSRWSVDKALGSLVANGLLLREYTHGKKRTPLLTPIYQDIPFDKVDSWVTDQLPVYGSEAMLLLHGLLAKAKASDSWDMHISNSWVRRVCNVGRYCVQKVLKKLVTLGLVDIYYIGPRRMIGVRALPNAEGELELVSDIPRPNIDKALERERMGREAARKLDRKKKEYVGRRVHKESYEQSYGWPAALTKEAHINTLIPSILSPARESGSFVKGGGGGFRDLDGGREDDMQIHRLPQYITKKNFKGITMKYPHPVNHPWFSSKLTPQEKAELEGMVPTQELYEVYAVAYQYGQKHEILKMSNFLKKMLSLKRRPTDGEPCCDEQMVKALGKYLHKAYPRQIAGLEKAGVRLDVNVKSIELIHTMKTVGAFADKKDFYEKFFEIEKKIKAYDPPELPPVRSNIEEFPDVREPEKIHCEKFVNNSSGDVVAPEGGMGRVIEDEGEVKTFVHNSSKYTEGLGSLIQQAKRSKERMQRDPERFAAAMEEMERCAAQMKAAMGQI